MVEQSREAIIEEQLILERHSADIGIATLIANLSINLVSVGAAAYKGSFAETIIALGWASGSTLAICFLEMAAEERIFRLRQELGLEYAPFAKTSLPAAETENKEPNEMDDWEDGGEEEAVGDKNNW